MLVHIFLFFTLRYIVHLIMVAVISQLLLVLDGDYDFVGLACSL